MKIRVLIAMLSCLLLLTACGNAAVNAVENTSPAQTTPNTITKEQARDIALEHAGFTADQVRYLHVQYEIDDGMPQYEVSFHHERWEYDYEINAETGDILSYDRDD